MANTHSSIATDSEAELRKILGNDATATFENDPTFIDAEPAAGSSDNLAVQQDDEDDEDDELDDEEDDEDDDEDLDDTEDDEAEAGAAPLQAKTFEDGGAADDEDGTALDEDGADLDEGGDDLDADRVGDAALGLTAPCMRPATSIRAAVWI